MPHSNGPESLTPDFRPGDTLMADTINQLVRQKNSPITVRVSPPLACRQEGSNIQIWLLKQIPYIVKGKVATGGITARTSDSAHGTGNVELWVKNPSTGAYEDSGIQMPCDYISSTTGGLSAGVWVNLGMRSDGGLEILSLDCAN